MVARFTHGRINICEEDYQYHFSFKFAKKTFVEWTAKANPCNIFGLVYIM